MLVARCDCKCAPLVVTINYAGRRSGYTKLGFGDSQDTGITYLAAHYNASVYGDGHAHDASVDLSTGIITYTPPFAHGSTPGAPDSVSAPYADTDFVTNSQGALGGNPYPDYDSDAAGAGGTSACKTGSSQVNYTNGDRLDRHNTAPSGALQLADLKYRLSVTFAHPWISGSIKFRWRERTESYTGTRMVQHGGPPSYTPTYQDSETASITYADRDETVTPAVGSMNATTADYLIECSGLSLGQTVTVVGPDTVADVPDSCLAFSVATISGYRSKWGATAYSRDPESGVITRYATETATSTTQSKVIYKGSYHSGVDGQYGSDGNGAGDPDSNTLSATVPRICVSSLASLLAVATYDPATIAAGQEIGTSDGGGCPWDYFTAQAAIVTPTKVTWKNGLILTLSNPVSTGDVQAAVNALIATDLDTSGFGSVQQRPALPLLVAKYNLPADETSCEMMRGIYAPYLLLSIDKGVSSQITGKLLTPATGSVTMQWNRYVLDLDTGVWGSPTSASRTVSYDAGSTAPWPFPDYTGQQIESVPGGNSEVWISDLAITSGDFARLVISPVAEIMPVSS